MTSHLNLKVTEMVHYVKSTAAFAYWYIINKHKPDLRLTVY